MNRHYPESIEEVWESYEWLLKEKLEELDRMSRNIYREMAITKTPAEKIRKRMKDGFAELWEMVATEQEETKANRKG